MRGISTGGRPTRASTDAERLAWLALATIPGIGARRLAQLTSEFGSAAAVLEASDQQLSHVDWLTGRSRALLRGASRPRAASLEQHAAAAGQSLLVPSDPPYPSRLRSIPDPPPILFARGDLSLFAKPTVAIVGSRRHTRYGADVAARLADEVVRAGAVVVSGMALGLDAVAQAAALDSGGGTIGVLGTGVDVVYPRQNARLFDRVIAQGALLSEHPPRDHGHHGAFPRRNRLISGLADALVVVEAADGSGTLITVNCALEQGRDVYAVPGPITSPTSRGTNRLIRDGAIPILEPDDLLRALGASDAIAKASIASPPCTLSPVEARVLAALRSDATHVDDLALEVGLPIGPLLGTLLGLELGGLAEQLPGSLFRRKT